MRRPAQDTLVVGSMTQAVIAAGLVNQAQLDEMKRWNPALAPVVDEVPPPKTLEEAAELVVEALQSEGYALVRETDLEVVHQYAATVTRGTLHLEVGTEGTDFEVTYGKTPIGEFIISWRSESIKDAMVNGQTYLIDGNTRVFFNDIRELFFGEQKAFMVCVPATVEHVS